MINKRLAIVALGLAGAILLAGTAAASLLEGKGSISGSVKAVDGKPYVGLVIKLQQTIPMSATPRGNKPKGNSSMGDSGADELQSQGKKNTRVKEIAKTTTDQAGKFSFTNIDEGAYRMLAGNRGIGFIYRDVNVMANEDTPLGEIQLVKPK